MKWCYHEIVGRSIFIPGNPVLCLTTTVQSWLCTNDLICYDPRVVFVCWHNTPFRYHHCAEIFEGIEENADGVYSSEWVSKIRSVLTIGII